MQTSRPTPTTPNSSAAPIRATVSARPCRHAVGDRWQVDETDVKIAGHWRYLYRAIDQFAQVIDVFVSMRRDAMAARCFFERAIGTTKVTPVEVVTDRAATYPMVLDALPPAAWHRTDPYAKALASHCTSWRWLGADSVGEAAAHAFDEAGVAGGGWLVEPFVLVVGLVAGEESGVVPVFDGGEVHAELLGELAGVSMPAARSRSRWLGSWWKRRSSSTIRPVKGLPSPERWPA
jgi:DDE domain